MPFGSRRRAQEKEKARVRAEMAAAFTEREVEIAGERQPDNEAEADPFSTLTFDEKAEALTLGVAALRQAIGGDPVDADEYLRQRAEAREARHQEQVQPAGAGTDLEAIDVLLRQAASLQAAAVSVLHDTYYS